MAIPEQLAFGRAGWHGDQAVSLRSGLEAMQPLVVDAKAKHNLVMAALELDGAVGGSYDPALVSVVADPAVPTMNFEHVANGGSYSHGDDAVTLRLVLQSLSVLALDLLNLHNAAVVELDANGGLGLTDYEANFAVSDPASASAMVHFASGGSSAHGDAGRQIGQLLTGVADLKAAHNAMITQLDADTTGGGYDVLANQVTAPSM